MTSSQTNVTKHFYLRGLLRGLVVCVALGAPTAKAAMMDYVKGCLVLGGVGIGGTMIAASTSKAEIKDTTALVFSGLTSCVIGGFLGQDIARKAQMEASAELALKNQTLKHRVYSVMHDLCVMKRQCGPDGLPLSPEDQDRLKNLQQYDPSTLNSGN